MFDTREYEWSDVTVILGGSIVTKIQGIQYTISQEKEFLYGKGNQPMAIQKGNFSNTGNVQLLQSSIDSLSAAGGANGMLDLQVDISVSYGNPSKGDVIRTDLLQGVQFTSEPREMKQGDKFMAAQSCDMMFLRKKRIM